VIAEAKHLKALGFNQSRACRVCLLTAVGEMLPAIEFNHQFGCVTHEVGDVATNRDLASEASTVQAMIA